MTDVFLNLQRSEASVVAAAATLLAAYIGQGKVNEQNEAVYLDKSVGLAIALVQRVDDAVKSDEEWTRTGGAAR